MNSSAFKANVHLNIVSSSSVFKKNPCIFVRREGKPSLTARPRRSRGSAFLKDADFFSNNKNNKKFSSFTCAYYSFLFVFFFINFSFTKESQSFFFLFGSMSFRSTDAHETFSSASQPV